MTSETEKPKTGKRRAGAKRSDRFLVALKGARRVLLLTHNNPDPDGIAAIASLELLLREKLGISSVLSYGGIVGRAENKSMIDLYFRGE